MWAFARHLWSQYAPEPHPSQLLTDAHLDKATNLDSWRVERAAPGRWLVEARDPASWFAHGPRGRFDLASAILEAARADFGDMLLTPAT